MEKKRLHNGIKWLAVTAASLLMGGAVTFCVQWITLAGAQSAWQWCLGAPSAFFFTALLYGGAIWFLALLLGQLFVSVFAVSLFGLGIALANYFKSAINGSPLEVEDFGMITQLDQIIDVSGGLHVPDFVWTIVALLLFLVFVLAFLHRLFEARGRWRYLSVSLGLVALLIFGVGPAAPSLGRAFGVDVENRIASRMAYQDYGLSLGLWRNCFLLANKPPEGYGPAYMEQILDRLDVVLEAYQKKTLAGLTPPVETPNVIVLLSESFFDLNRLPGLKTASDPLENFHRLQGQSVSGRFYTSYVGYGTGYIEVSMFTGVNGKDLKPDENMCFRDPEAYTVLDSMVQPYRRKGYQTEMLHAYNNTLYNRVRNYPLLGFNDALFSAQVQALDIDIQGSPYAGGYYLSDHVFNEGILKRFEDITAGGDKAFLYGISMENHQPFKFDKFGEECQIEMTSDVLSDDDLAIAKVMLEGVTRADQALGELTDALMESDEPTIVFFFGDHRPNLFMTDGDTVYSHLGLCDGNDCANWTVEQVADLYSTDYLLWANDAALLQGAAGTREDTSLTAITPKLLEYSGMLKSRYWLMQAAVSDILKVDTDLYCVDAGGTPHWNSGEADLTAEEEQLLSLRGAVLYDALYGQHYISDAMNQPPGTK